MRGALRKGFKSKALEIVSPVDHRWYAILFGVAWIGILLLAILGTRLPFGAGGRALFIGFLALFLLQTACLMPLMLWLFVKLAIRLGQRDIAQTINASERVLIRIYWVICGIAALVAVPFLLRSAFR